MTRLEALVANRYWQFSHRDGPIVASSLWFAPDGRVRGYAHPNEHGWRIEDGTLVLLSRDGTVSTRLTRADENDAGLRLEGRFGLYDVGHDLVLRLETQPEDWRPPVPAPTRDALRDGVARFGWQIGDYTYGTPEVIDPEYGSLSIGRFCSIASHVTIVIGNHDHRLITTYPFATLGRDWPTLPDGASDHVGRGETRIGHDVWIGKGAFVMPGVTIGDGAVIGAAAVVTRDVAPYAIAVGNPARSVSVRFPEHQVRRLLALQWWHWPLQKLETLLPLLLSRDVERFLDAAEG